MHDLKMKQYLRKFKNCKQYIVYRVWIGVDRDGFISDIIMRLMNFVTSCFG